MPPILELILGLGVLIGGAELLVRGGAGLATRLGVRPMVIGLTVVAMGTSLPELAVGIEAARLGSDGLAVGNIAGSNIVNILLILGLVGAIRPVLTHSQTLRFDLPIVVGVSVLLLLMSLNGNLSLLEGLVLLGGAVLYGLALFRISQRDSQAAKAEAASHESRSGAEQETRRALWLGVARQVALVVVGLVLTLLGANWMVAGATTLAALLGVSEAVIGLTIVAVGTSAPELVTAVVASIRGQRDIAVGNVLGSNVFNILLILGATVVVAPGGIDVPPELVRVDLPLMVAVAAICVPVFWSDRRFSRLEGALLVLAYVTYVAYLVTVRT